jgi:hypothetical protein
MQLFSRESKAAAPQDALTEAQQNADRLVTALAKAESESADARITYDRAMHEFVASGKQEREPSLEPQREAAGRVESLRRLLAETRQHLMRVTTEAEAAKRLDAIRASGSHVADLTSAAEAKLAAFEAAVDAKHKAEAELFAALFDSQTGLKQRCGVAQKDADFARGRLRCQAIKIAKRGHCLIDARFEVDGEIHLGPLEAGFYSAAAQ